VEGGMGRATKLEAEQETRLQSGQEAKLEAGLEIGWLGSGDEARVGPGQGWVSKALVFLGLPLHVGLTSAMFVGDIYRPYVYPLCTHLTAQCCGI